MGAHSPKEVVPPQEQQHTTPVSILLGIPGLLVTKHNKKGMENVPEWVHGHFHICKVDSFWFDSNFHRIVNDTLYTNNNSDSGHGIRQQSRRRVDEG